MSTSKKRGPKTSRSVYFICAAIIDGELIQESVTPQVEDHRNYTDKQLYQMAVKLFLNTYNIKPQKVKGPCFFRKGTTLKVKQSHKKDTDINVDITKVKYEPTTSVGEYNGKKVLITYCSNPVACIDSYSLMYGNVCHIFFTNKNKWEGKWVFEKDILNISPCFSFI